MRPLVAPFATKGRFLPGQDLAPLTWLRVGGPADALFMPAELSELSHVLAAMPDAEVRVMGAASNLIVRDGGVRALVVKLSAGFAKLSHEDGLLTAGAAALDKSVARYAQTHGLTGLEFLAGIPGTIGGAVAMNAGCYGHETTDRLKDITVVDRRGRVSRIPSKELAMSYRHAELPQGAIVVEARFEVEPGDAERIHTRMEEITTAREESQPIREKTGGSTFANPDPPSTPNQRKAWQLIDSVGGRGLTRGDAQFSEQHCNFLINMGEATAADLEDLGEDVRARVLAKHGVELRWEVQRWGERAHVASATEPA